MKNLVCLLCLMLTFSPIINAQTGLDFDGIDDFVVGTDSGLPGGTSDRTIEGWVNLTAAPSVFGPIFEYGNAVAGQRFGFGVHSTGVPFFWGHSADVLGTINVVDGSWHHIAVTYDGTISIYVDGVLDITASPGINTTFNGVYRIGECNGNGWKYAGKMDEVRVWNVARTQSEIQTNMNSCLTGSESGLVALFDFEDGTGSSVLTDLTGNGYNGTLTNMDASTDWVSGITCGSCAIADQTLLEADWSDCPGVDSLITLNGSEVGINYYLRDDANNIVIDGPIAGTGSAINLNTGPINSNTTFNVIASQSTIPPGSGGILFDGVDDHIDLAIDCNETEYTAEVWIKTTNPNCGIMHHDGATGGFGGGHDRHLYLSGGDIYARLWMNETISTTGTNFADGNWHHIAYTFGGTNGAQKIYVDGVLEATGTLTMSSWNGSSINLGYSSDVGTYFQGEMDEFRIWTISRSQAEIQADMNSCLTGSESGLQVLYQFDNGSGTVVTDLAGNDHMGDMFNTAPSAWTTNGVNCGSTICAMEMTDMLTVTVSDSQNPTASNPGGMSVECVSNIPSPDPSVVTDEADNCGTPSVYFISDVSDGNSCPEVITRTYRVDDNNGNTIDVTQTFTVNDVTPPTASNPADINVECIGDVPSADPAVVTDEADNCGTPTVAFVSEVSDGNTCPETITRTYSVTDNCGNSINVQQSIIVNDVTPPTASNPTTINVECIGDVPAADITVVTDEADNCSTTPVVAFVSDVSDGNTCPETITRTYSVTDDCGNSINVQQSIIVNDVTPPTASNPADMNVECIGDVPAADPAVVNDEADNCGTPTVAFVSDVSDGNTCPETITRTYSVTDDCGNSINVQQSIIVNDVTPPTASNPTTINVECIGDVPAADITVVTDEADNCSTTPVVAFVSDVSDGNTCPETITRTYSVTDNCGNSINVQQSIIVNDVTPPTASNPADINVECIGDVPAADITVVTDEADNCSTTPVVAFVSDVSDGNTCPETITRTYSVTDDCGNSINVQQSIIVNDVTPPTASNPADINIECAIAIPPADPSVVTDEADNCSTTPVVAFVSDVSDGNTCPETITRTYSITDDCGNVSTVTQNIIINDITPPNVSCPSDINLNADQSGCGAIANWGATMPSDNCTTVPFFSETHSSGTLFSLGTTTVSFTAMDDCGNVASCQFDVNVINTLSVALDSVWNVMCADSIDGQAFVTTSAGNSPYSYDWDHDGSGDNDDSEDQDGLADGTYNLTVIDAAGCTASTSATITEPAALTVTVDATMNPTSCGVADGSIMITAAGGTGTIVYDWDNDGTGDFDDLEDISSLLAGSYVVEVMDDNGCTATTSASLSDPAGPVVSITGTTDNLCFQDSLGAIDATIIGGLMPITIDWDNDGTGDNDDSEDIMNLWAATYNVTVTDANGCVGSASATITEPTEISATPTLSNVLCHGDSTGTATLNLTGGTGALIEDWGSNDPSMLWAGYHTYTITDANNCTLIDSVEIMQADSISYTDSTLNISCFGQADGEIYITPAGGTPAYLVIWSSDTSNSQTGLAATYHTFTIEDANMCTLTDSIEITEPALLTISSTITNEMGGSDGSIDLTVNGGTSPYTFDWDNDGTGDNDDSEDLNLLDPGTYSVVVTDANGCNVSEAYLVDSELDLTQLEDLIIEVYPNPSKGEFSVKHYGSANVSFIQIIDAAGKVIQSRNVDNSIELISFDISHLEDGLYFIHLYDESGNLHSRRLIKH